MHSLRIEPISRSAYAFCQGERGDVGRSRMPMDRTRRMSGRGRLVHLLRGYFGRVRLLHRTHWRLWLPAFPSTSQPRLAGTRWRSPGSRAKGLCACQGLRRRGVDEHLANAMPTIWPSVGPENIGTPNLAYAAQYLACNIPCERFTSPLTD